VKKIVIAAACALVVLSAAIARAEDYPSRPIRLILPQPAGGAVDLIARTLGDRLAEQMHQPVIVENIPGANGSLAAGQVARATPDGYTLMLAVDSNLVINPSLYNNLTYDPFRDFAPISIIAKLHMVLVANPKVPANDVRELIAYAKAHPNKLNYASIGFGTAMHMGMELFKYDTHTEINQVSYRGTAPAMTDVVAGIVDVMFTGPPSAKAMSEGGKLKLLAVASPQRMPSMPDVPTVSEEGVPGFEMASWFGLLAPAKTPSEIVERLAKEVQKAVVDPKFTDKMSAQGLDVVGSTPDGMLETMKADTKKWSEVIKATDIKIP
jgi:tripartite-type tricarboxylate transporter receptor subunit TctC